MKKTTFIRTIAALCLVLLSVFSSTNKLWAQEKNYHTLMIKTNQADLIKQGLLKAGETVGKVFVGIDAAAPTGDDGSFSMLIPLKGHPQWNKQWESVHIKAIPSKGLAVKSIEWYNTNNTTLVHEMDNDKAIKRSLIKSDAVMTIMYTAAEEAPQPNPTETDEEDDVEECKITYKIKHGEGSFNVIRAEEEDDNTYLLKKGELLTIEVIPEDEYKIGYVAYEGKKILANQFNSYFRHSIGSIKKDTHFDVVFVKEDGSEDALIDKPLDNSTAVESLNPQSLTPYPNPCTTHLYLGVEGSVRIYNLLGQLVQSGHSQDGYIDIHQRAKGIYIVELTDATGMRHTTRVEKR